MQNFVIIFSTLLLFFSFLVRACLFQYASVSKPALLGFILGVLYTCHPKLLTTIFRINQFSLSLYCLLYERSLKVNQDFLIFQFKKFLQSKIAFREILFDHHPIFADFVLTKNDNEFFGQFLGIKFVKNNYFKIFKSI